MTSKTAIALSLTLLCGASATTAAADDYDPDDYASTSHCSMKVKPRYSMTALLRHGVRVPVTCDGPAFVLVSMQIDRPKLLDLRMPGNGIQDIAGVRQIGSAGRHVIKLTVDRRSRRHLGPRDTTFSGLMGLCVGPYGKNSCGADPKDNRRVTFTR